MSGGVNGQHLQICMQSGFAPEPACRAGQVFPGCAWSCGLFAPATTHRVVVGMSKGKTDLLAKEKPLSSTLKEGGSVRQSQRKVLIFSR